MLAEKCGLHVQTISYFEQDKKIPSKRTLEIIVSAFEMEDIIFLEGEGIQKSRNRVVTYKNKEGFIKFRQDVLKTAQEKCRDICVSNVDEKYFDYWGRDTINDFYRSEMAKIKNLKFRILIKEGDMNLVARKYAEYRWASKEDFGEIPFYIYGNKTAIFSFQENEMHIFVIEHPLIAKFYKQQFEEKWAKSRLIQENKILEKAV